MPSATDPYFPLLSSGTPHPHGGSPPHHTQCRRAPAHEFSEYIVCRRKHLRPASKVFVEINPLLTFSLFLIRVIFFQKQLQPRQTKTIDTLLDIADHKPVPPAVLLTGHRREQCLLDKVAVLVLIDHNFPELLRQFPRRIGPHQAAVFLLHENFKRKVFQIGIIENIFAPFFSANAFANCSVRSISTPIAPGSRQSPPQSQRCPSQKTAPLTSAAPFCMHRAPPLPDLSAFHSHRLPFSAKVL